MNEKKVRVTDALNVTKAAIEKGIVPGMFVRHSCSLCLLSHCKSITSVTIFIQFRILVTIILKLCWLCPYGQRLSDDAPH